MTVRYSHLAPDFLLDVVEKLVPKPRGRVTRTNNSTPESFRRSRSGGACPVSLFRVRCCDNFRGVAQW